MGNVPNLRFPEFCGEWETIKVSELLDFYSTNSLSWEQLDYSNGKIKNLHYGLIHKGVPTMVDVACDSLPYIKEESMLKSFTLFKEGDVAFADASEDTNDVAKAIEVVNCDNQQIVSGLHTIHGRDNSNRTVIGYKGYAFASDSFHKQIRRIAQGTKVFSISVRNFDEAYIGIPSKEEQTQIAKLLITIDKRIATQNKIIEDLKKLKSAISKQVFAQKPSGSNRLDSLFSKGKAGGTPTSTNKEYYNGEIPFLSINDITKQGKYVRYTENHLSQSGLENSSAWVVPKYSLIMSMYASVGLVTINEIPITTSQAMFAMQLKNKDLLDYLYYYLSYFKYRHIHKYLETGTQSNINADIVRGIMIPTYGHSRNMEISSTLQGIDVKIDNELSVLKLFNRQKNYLLSQMFI
ncbi:type I restriction modification DNA specificity domain protein [Bacteroides fragilis str. S24L15]|uniref:restriction endonuclease subunit S n=1 Tax=Bacteroides fragilis TaxID=817 RepID=UPI00044F84AB|nr:restriction endonuclease subunit S [Bacteroides fragilis]EYA72262.1 type I restriction modification DNA specificity domain protein [Bacteroides fragilis str. S24L15]EYA76762.1 type I restriction modification DNA specificity domain protein [Bacteroides fragilis str. S24L26]